MSELKRRLIDRSLDPDGFDRDALRTVREQWLPDRHDLPVEVYAELRREGFVEVRDEEAANLEDERWADERATGGMPSE